MTSIKEEDIFNICETNCCGDNNKLLFPQTIGNNDFKRKLNNKMYIWSQETCIICMDKIQTISNAYLTDCGHSFHKKCLTQYFHYIQMVSNKNLKCPICRCNLGKPILNERYNFCHSSINSLDILEDFNVEMLHICRSFTNKKNHYLGINSNCEKCIYYRKYG